MYKRKNHNLRNSLLVLLVLTAIGGAYWLGERDGDPLHGRKAGSMQTRATKLEKNVFVPRAPILFEDKRYLEPIKERYVTIGKDSSETLEKIKSYPAEAREEFLLPEELPPGFQWVNYSIKDKYPARASLENRATNENCRIDEDVLKSIEWHLQLKYQLTDKEIIKKKCEEKGSFLTGRDGVEFFAEYIKFDGTIPLSYCLRELSHTIGDDAIVYTGKNKLIFFAPGFPDYKGNSEVFSRYTSRLGITSLYKEIAPIVAQTPTRLPDN